MDEIISADEHHVPLLEPSSESCNESIVALKNAWICEVCAPEILPYEAELIDDINSQLKERQNILDVEREDPDEIFSANMYQMEANRIKYSLSKYLRTRLQKIEAFVHHILENQEIRDRLSEVELNYAQTYRELVKSHMDATVLSHLHKNFRQLNKVDRDEDMVPRPELDRFVIFRVKQEVENFLVNDEAGSEEVQNLEEGDIHIMRYQRIKGLLLEQKIELI
mmetsp:Transcript_25435/g.33002  ORF Transcript_25435/g.33002 Transcript_25435/m.33002 type:complete len:223 (-) Transcript_25435:248-916(-)